jgi:prepilin-type N-terminal cleavage/methylation domain-containing protein
MKTSAQGFTLLELAIVIALIAILASFAVLRFAQLEDSAHRAMAQRFLSQLISAAAVATAETSTAPTAFTQFVTTTSAGVGGVSVAPFTYTLNIPPAINGGAVPCAAPTATAITCTGWGGALGTVTYTLNASGQIAASNTGTLKL